MSTEQTPPNPNRHVTACAICCNEGAFAKFLSLNEEKQWENARKDVDAQEVGTKRPKNQATFCTYRILEIKSRTELRTDPAKAERWAKLKSDYDLWMEVD
jgi:hypothetical protein